MVGGKMVKEMQGYNRAKGGKGKQDIDATINGINVKLELKCPGDEQKPEQKKYQERVEAAQGFYIILRSMFELFTVVDMCNAGQSLKGVKFHDK